MAFRRANFICVLAFCFAITAAFAQPSNTRWEYIQRYKEIAVKEMQRTGVPASIKLAQGLLESGAGSSSLAKEANNHFGMKCGASWTGETYYLKDDDYDENGVLKESCFRVFKSAEESYIAHSEFLRDPNKAYRYGFLFRLDPKDYKKWAQGLTDAGYATSPTYAGALIGIIDQYQLYIYDVGGGTPQLVDIILVNDVKMTMSKAGQTPAEIASKYNVKLTKLLKYNEDLKGPSQPLQANQRIFLQKKRRFFRGGQKDHYVREGENIYDIAQLYGVRVKSLRKKNKIPSSAEPAVGERIYLRGWRFGRVTPKLRDANYVPPPTPPFDEGTGVVDENNEVNPDDLKNNTNTNGENTTNSNSDNSANSNSSSNNTTNTNNNTTPTNNTTKPNTNGNGGTTTPPTKPTTNPNTSNNNTNTPKTNSNNGSNTTKPTETKPTKPATTTGTTTKPTTTPSNPKTEVKPKPTTDTNTKPTTPTIPTTKPSTPNTTPTTPTTNPTDASPVSVQYHVVEPKETLYSISKRYGLTVEGLKMLNGLTMNNLSVGQKLRLN